MATQFPDDFKCPISLEIMSDPVIISSGHTFDRSSIQRWLDSGHRTCPITKQPLLEHPPLLIPNHTLRSLISNYTLLPAPSSQPDPGTLIATLTSKLSSVNSKLDSLSQLTKLTKFDPSVRRQLSESGAVSAVIKCANSSELGEKALSLLLVLSLDDDNKVGLVAEGVISQIVKVVQAGSPNAQALACTILTSLAVVEVNKATIGSYPKAIQALVNLLNYGKGREVKEAATALYAICFYPENRRRVVGYGAVPILVRIVGEAGMERAIAVLSVLVKCKEGREAMGKIEGCVKVLMKVLTIRNERSVQFALSILNCLCSYSERMCGEVRREGAVEICAGGGLVTDENEKIRTNATNLVLTLTGSRASV